MLPDVSLISCLLTGFQHQLNGVIIHQPSDYSLFVFCFAFSPIIPSEICQFLEHLLLATLHKTFMVENLSIYNDLC